MAASALEEIQAAVDDVRMPNQNSRIFKKECMFSFDNPFTPTGTPLPCRRLFVLLVSASGVWVVGGLAAAHALPFGFEERVCVTSRSLAPWVWATNPDKPTVASSAGAGIYTSLNSWQCFGDAYLARDHERTGHRLYLHQRWEKVRPCLSSRKGQGLDYLGGGAVRVFR